MSLVLAMLFELTEEVTVLVYFTICILVLLGFVGLAIDVGRMELRTIQLQAAADDGALMAVTEYQRGNSSWQMLTTSEVTSFAAAASIPSVTTAVQQTAGVGPYMADYSSLQVTVTQQFPIYFMSVLKGSNTTTLSAKAVAVVPPCSFFMNSTSESLHLASTGFSTSCPIYTNYGITNDGFSSYHTMEAKIAGPAGQSFLPGYETPAVIQDTPTLSDPLAYITAPVFSSCTYILTTAIILPVTIYPGTYCGGAIVLNTSVTMMPGLYIFIGGATITNSTVTGTGVTMYFTKGGIYGYGQFNVNGNSVMHVSAPTDSSGGGIPGVVVFGDRNWPSTFADFHFNGCTWQGDGIIYTTNTGISDQYCNMSGNHYFGVVTNYMYEYQSNFYPSSDYSTLPGGNPFHLAATLVQ